MALFYRGIGVGTYDYTKDARISGFAPRSPSIPSGNTIDILLQHIAGENTASPFVSLTRSFGVAWSYAVFHSRAVPSNIQPAHVYQIQFPDPLPPSPQLIDPIKDISNALPPPHASLSYQHDGGPEFLLGIADSRMKRYRNKNIRIPPNKIGNRPPNLSNELEALVNTLRDAEVIVMGNIPSNFITNRFDVWR